VIRALQIPAAAVREISLLPHWGMTRAERAAHILEIVASALSTNAGLHVRIAASELDDAAALLRSKDKMEF
jgi:hypothetical protein